MKYSRPMRMLRLLMNFNLCIRWVMRHQTKWLAFSWCRRVHYSGHALVIIRPLDFWLGRVHNKIPLRTTSSCRMRAFCHWIKKCSCRRPRGKLVDVSFCHSPGARNWQKHAESAKEIVQNCCYSEITKIYFLIYKSFCCFFSRSNLNFWNFCMRNVLKMHLNGK
jgi:hypothetical protein